MSIINDNPQTGVTAKEVTETTVTTAKDLARAAREDSSSKKAQRQKIAEEYAESFVRTEMLEKLQLSIVIEETEAREMWPDVSYIVMDLLHTKHKLDVVRKSRSRLVGGWFGTDLFAREETYYIYEISVPYDTIRSV